MPLSKARDRERKRHQVRLERRLFTLLDEVRMLYPDKRLPDRPDGRYLGWKARDVIPSNKTRLETPISKLPWYSGASNHFGKE